MSRATVSLGSTAGERITIALVVLTLCAEVLSDNACRPTPVPTITLAECRETCGEGPDERRIRRYERFVCECSVPGQAP